MCICVCLDNDENDESDENVFHVYSMCVCLDNDEIVFQFVCVSMCFPCLLDNVCPL